MIKLTEVSIKTDFLLIEAVTMSFEEGQIYGISAPNGTGKSTFLRTLADLRTEKAGSLELFLGDRKITSSCERKEHLFYFETTNWFDLNLSGSDYLQLIQEQWKTNKRLIEQAVVFWDLGEYIYRPIKKYSLGMKQKLLLSMYYVSDAVFWLLDEPTLALDKTSVEKLQSFIKLAKDKHKCIIFSAHENDTFFAICDTVYSIENRRFIKKEKGE